MAWEERAGKRYYYRKIRHGDRVVSEYVGAGPLAETAAAMHALQAALRRAEREAWAARHALDARIDETCHLLTALAHATLLAAGYHHHRGHWRKKRRA